MNKIIISMLIAGVITLSAAAYSEEVECDLQNNIVRLHIIANSDSDADQSVKLKVRDAVLEKAGKNLAVQNSNNIEAQLPVIEKIANDILAENNFPYHAKAVYGKFDFPKKEYKNLTLPCGKYYGVRIILGEGAGHNWWCVMYPPLCMMNDNEAVLSKNSEKILKEKLNPETYEIITGTGDKIKVRFKIVDAIQELKQLLKKEIG